jgi:hypothetical protein
MAALAFTACRPSSVREAEAKGDVKWLEQSGSPDAVAALGRLADKDPMAVSALYARANVDANVYLAAWNATVRGAAWGPTLLKIALGDATRAEIAAQSMDRHDARIAMFADDLEGALTRLGASAVNTGVASSLASCGPAARPCIERRLADGATRAAMCRGISAPDTSADAKSALLAVPAASRDASSCVDAVVRFAADDDDALAWIATSSEPGILGAAGKSDTLVCPRVHVLWTQALAKRTPDVYPALVVPLASAIRRCTSELDAVLFDALSRLPQTHVVVVNAIDPFDSYGKNLPATCEALKKIANGSSGDAAVVRERADDALDHACKLH